MESAKKFRIVFVTVGSLSNGKRIAHDLVGKGLAACVNIVPQIRSIYSWKGKVMDDRELLLIIKTQSKNLDRLEKMVKKLHTYDVPEIISLPLHKGHQAYLKWLNQETK